MESIGYEHNPKSKEKREQEESVFMAVIYVLRKSSIHGSYVVENGHRNLCSSTADLYRCALSNDKY